MKEDPISQEQKRPGDIARQHLTEQSDEREETGFDIPLPLAEYTPEHLCNFYDLLKADYQEMRKANRIIQYVTLLIICLCLLVGIVILFLNGFVVAGSIVSGVSVAIGFITRLIKVKDRPREDMDRHLEIMRQTALDIERIHLRMHFATTITDPEQRDEVREYLAEEEFGQEPERSYEPHRHGLPPRRDVFAHSQETEQPPHRERET
ncbi:MAG: hypothetical protein H0W02_06770 [Ktedonobacteraceae bacterium]|nr:hypothetical protein [Ktedonobacteraceae bacterium]